MPSDSIVAGQRQQSLVLRATPEEDPATQRGIRSFLVVIGLGLAIWLITGVALAVAILR